MLHITTSDIDRLGELYGFVPIYHVRALNQDGPTSQIWRARPFMINLVDKNYDTQAYMEILTTRCFVFFIQNGHHFETIGCTVNGQVQFSFKWSELSHKMKWELVECHPVEVQGI